MHLHLEYIRFSQKLVRVLGSEETLPWARRCNKLHSTICIVLLSEFVSWNAWLQHFQMWLKIHLPSVLVPHRYRCARGQWKMTRTHQRRGRTDKVFELGPKRLGRS